MFEELPEPQQYIAQKWLSLWCRRWHSNLPGWRYALLTAAAKSLALHPHGSARGWQMRAVKGGKARARLHPYSREYMSALGTRGRERQKYLRVNAVCNALKMIRFAALKVIHPGLVG